jgi:hypothetical protein
VAARPRLDPLHDQEGRAAAWDRPRADHLRRGDRPRRVQWSAASPRRKCGDCGYLTSTAWCLTRRLVDIAAPNGWKPVMDWVACGV